MLAWWNELTQFQQIMVGIATPATIIVIIQLFFVLFGFSSDDSFDTVPDTDTVDFSVDHTNDEGIFNLGGLKVITLRGILAFLSVGGWVAMAVSYTAHPAVASLIGALSGAAVAVLIAVAMHYAMKLQSTGNLNYQNALGKSATVYIRIPPKRSGKGKVTLTIQERFVEIDAVTDDKTYIDTGSMVDVIELEGENTLVVSRRKG